MPKTTREEGPPVDPPPAGARDEFTDLSLTALPKRRAARSADECGHESGELTEAELLGVMSLQRFDPSAARDAWDEMYRRHSRYVAAVIVRAFGERARDADAVSDIVGDTFRTVFDWAGRQHCAEEVAGRFWAADRESIRRRVAGYLAVVARRLAARRFAVQASGPREFLDSEIERTAAATGEETEPPPAAAHSRLEAVLELLGSDEAEALRVSFPWYQVETGEFAFPRGEAARVAASLGITPDALRQRRCRSLKRLHSLLRDK